MIYYEGASSRAQPARCCGGTATRSSGAPRRCLALRGRVDDTMNLGGIKVGSAEIERVVRMACRHVIERRRSPWLAHRWAEPARDLRRCANGASDAGQADGLRWQDAIRRDLNPLFKIHDLVFIETLPRTASNKVMRRPLPGPLYCQPMSNTETSCADHRGRQLPGAAGSGCVSPRPAISILASDLVADRAAETAAAYPRRRRPGRGRVRARCRLGEGRRGGPLRHRRSRRRPHQQCRHPETGERRNVSGGQVASAHGRDDDGAVPHDEGGSPRHAGSRLRAAGAHRLSFSFAAPRRRSSRHTSRRSTRTWSASRRSSPSKRRGPTSRAT